MSVKNVGQPMLYSRNLIPVTIKPGYKKPGQATSSWHRLTGAEAIVRLDGHTLLLHFPSMEQEKRLRHGPQVRSRSKNVEDIPF